MCSTAGEILGTQASDGGLSLTAVRFDHARVVGRSVEMNPEESTARAATRLAASIPRDGLRHVFVVTDGLTVNGTEFVRAFEAALPASVSITGGLSADGEAFARTFVGLNGPGRERTLAAVGFYGDRLKVGFGSLGGWDSFGPERLVTRAENNVLYELDGKSALSLYKLYLGEYAAGLPATGLLFPLSVRTEGGSTGTVRTILSVDESAGSLTFAGDIPPGSYARLMRANFDRLIDGASAAAHSAHERLGQFQPELAILVSCVGRKMVLRQRVEEELESVRDVFGEATKLTGFYSYGELCPQLPSTRCELHNQTMSITALAE